MDQYISCQSERLFSAKVRKPRISGQGLIEYALIVLLVALVAVVVLSMVGGEVNQVFQDILNGFNS